ncbi:MAG: acyl-CoA desaturase [Acidobacteria bacterium]|nr:acyl-CoA desaturase [Acidobacteriota bacterium]MCZ6879052.1 acyl-CoA desaturase [Acidobacteriota bacterium]
MKANWLAVSRWFDSSVSDGPVLESEFKDIDWVRGIPFLGLHLMCLGVIWVGWSWIAVLVAVLLYFIRMFAVTGFYHRYFSHRSFKTSRWGQFLFAVCGNSAVQKGPLWWAAHHRHHHRHSDKETDVHSPHQDGFFWSHIGWITCKGNFPTNLKNVPDLAKFPELRFLDRFETVVPLFLATSLFATGALLNSVAPQLGTSGMQMLIWGFFISTIVLFHGTCTINSLSHLMGGKRYKTSDESRNNLLLALITLGEGWHNNHHHFSASVRQGFYWWEIDITYYGLCLLSWTGLIWDLTPVPQGVRAARRVGS